MMIRFDFIPYPLWRRDLSPLPTALHAPARRLLRPLWGAFSAADFDADPPADPMRGADFLARGRLLPRGMDAAAAKSALASLASPALATADAKPDRAPALPLRLPAQWERMEAVALTFPVLYPPLWATHAAIIAAIIDADARPDVLIPSAAWGSLVAFYLAEAHGIDLSRVRLIVLPTDDIWVRDYGAFIGIDADGRRAAVGMTYDPLPTYPQMRDDAMSASYAALLGLPFHKLDLHMEGGNIWSDGTGTLILSDDLYGRNPHLERDEVVERLREAFAFEALIITPRLWREETGHVDLLVKLADARTALVCAPSVPFQRARLREAAALLRRSTNAAGERYRVIELPMPMPYLNWGFAIWRSYSNSLTVNGRVLVPIFGDPADALALHLYRSAMPDHEIIPIDCAAAANGGGAVHCLTKEVALGGG
jgi:agmatine deiminase